MRVEQLAQVGSSSLSSPAAAGRRRTAAAPSTRGDHPGRRIADAEQPALALRDDLEADRRLVEPRRQPLELAQRLPLRLADGLARRLDLGSPVARRVTCGRPSSSCA